MTPSLAVLNKNKYCPVIKTKHRIGICDVCIALDRQREDMKKMLWSLYVDEENEEAISWNGSLDLAIFKLKTLTTEGDGEEKKG